MTVERLKEKKTVEEKLKQEVEEGNAERSSNGIYVEALTAEIRKKYRIRDEIKGVRVVKVDKRAEATGKILKGDIIEEVGFEQIASPKEFEEAMKLAAEGDSPVTILVNRSGNYIFHALGVG